jgi:hypothetical protein
LEVEGNTIDGECTSFTHKVWDNKKSQKPLAMPLLQQAICHASLSLLDLVKYPFLIK